MQENGYLRFIGLRGGGQRDKEKGGFVGKRRRGRGGQNEVRTVCMDVVHSTLCMQIGKWAVASPETRCSPLSARMS